jgi:hypothetical protein
MVRDHTTTRRRASGALAASSCAPPLRLAWRGGRCRKSRIAIPGLSRSVGLDALSEIVHLSSERTLELARRHSSFAEKQQPHPAS